MRCIKNSIKRVYKIISAVLHISAVCVLFSCSRSTNNGNVIGTHIDEDYIDFVPPLDRVSLSKGFESVHEDSFSVQNLPFGTELRYSGKFVTIDDSLLEYGKLREPQCQYYLCYDCIEDGVPERPFLLANCYSKTSDYTPTFSDFVFHFFQPPELVVNLKFNLYSYPLDDEFEFSIDEVEFDYFTIDWKDDSVARWGYISYLRSGDVKLGYMYFGLERKTTTEWITKHMKSWLVCSNFNICKSSV